MKEDTHRPLSGPLLPYYRILDINHKKELLRGLWAGWGFLDIRHDPPAKLPGKKTGGHH